MASAIPAGGRPGSTTGSRGPLAARARTSSGRSRPLQALVGGGGDDDGRPRRLGEPEGEGRDPAGAERRHDAPGLSPPSTAPGGEPGRGGRGRPGAAVLSGARASRAAGPTTASRAWPWSVPAGRARRDPPHPRPFPGRREGGSHRGPLPAGESRGGAPLPRLACRDPRADDVPRPGRALTGGIPPRQGLPGRDEAPGGGCPAAPEAHLARAPGPLPPAGGARERAPRRHGPPPHPGASRPGTTPSGGPEPPTCRSRGGRSPYPSHDGAGRGRCRRGAGLERGDPRRRETGARRRARREVAPPRGPEAPGPEPGALSVEPRKRRHGRHGPDAPLPWAGGPATGPRPRRGATHPPPQAPGPAPRLRRRPPPPPPAPPAGLPPPPPNRPASPTALPPPSPSSPPLRPARAACANTGGGRRSRVRPAPEAHPVVESPGLRFAETPLCR